MGKGGSQTIGYKHYVGLHSVFCHGPIDKFVRLSVDDRIAWEGGAAGGTITVSAPELFGGESREGGVSGKVDVQMGGPAQGKNAYLLSKIGPDIPAYRGVAALVFKDFYWGNNPYLKPMKARGQRIHVRQDGLAQWYDGKAEIDTGNPAEFTGWYARCVIRNTKDGAPYGLGGWYLAPNTGPTIFYNSNFIWGGTSNEEFPGGIPAIVYHPDGGGATVYFCNPGVMDATTLDLRQQHGAGTGIKYCTLTWQFWNEESAGGLAPFAGESGGSPFWVGQLFPQNWYFYTEGSGVPMVGEPTGDMNFVHMIRENLTDPDWGMGYTDDDIDDDSFEDAADTIFDEQLGGSILWDRQIKIEDFTNELVRHIDAALFVSRTTGKFKIKLIRNDYDPADLPLFDESNIESIESPSRAAFGELINSVTIQFWNKATGKDDSITVQDPAAVQQQGQVIGTTLQYPGFTTTRNADIVGQRDLRALSNPFLSCIIVTGEDGRELEPGDVFKLSWAKWGLANVVMRVTGYALSEGRQTRVRLTCVEDVFATPVNPLFAPPGDGWVDPSQPPEPVETQIADEVPYYEIVQARGQTQADSEIAANPEIGFVFAAAARPASAINARLWTDAGGGFEQVGTFDFAPTGDLAGPMSKTATTATLTGGQDLDLVTEGSFGQIGEGETMELVRVDSIDATTGALVIGRGVLDTVPHEHLAGETVVFWDLYAGVDPTEYAAGEEVDLRITPVSGAGQVALADAATISVTLDQRAARPYPPGDLTVDGERYAPAAYNGELEIDWTHRDRTQQTGGEFDDHLAGDIGPEIGTLYRVRTYLDGVLDDEQDDLAAGPALVTPSGDGIVRVEVASKRDGLFSMQSASHEFPYAESGEPRLIEDAEGYRATEDGDMRISED